MKKFVFLLMIVFCLYEQVYAVDVSTNNAVGSPKGSFTLSSMGGAVYSVTIDAPKGSGNMQPNIALTYNSQAGYGIVGYGFNITGISAITRGCKDIYHDGVARVISHTANDAFFIDGKRLVLLSGQKGNEGAVYVPEGEPFTKVTFHGDFDVGSTSGWMEVTTPDGIRYEYGHNKNAIINYTTAGITYVDAWYVNRADDALGRYINYEYAPSYLCQYPQTITYGIEGGVTNYIKFSYGWAVDRASHGFKLGSATGGIYNKLEQITTGTNVEVFRTYTCVYDSVLDASMVKYSRLIKIIEENAQGESLNPITFNWKRLGGMVRKVSSPQIDADYKEANQDIFYKTFISADLNGDGLSDIVKLALARDYIVNNANNKIFSDLTIAYIYLANRHDDGTISYDYAYQRKIDKVCDVLGIASRPGGGSVLDFNGDGKADVLVPILETDSNLGQDSQYVAWYLLLGPTASIGGIATHLRATSEMPLYTQLDINKNGRGEILYLEIQPKDGKYLGGCISCDDKGAAKESLLSFTLPNAPKRVFTGDFNNDGLTDIIILYDGGYKVFFNQGTGNFATAFSDAKVVQDTSFGNNYRVEQGDFNGDGLVDFVFSDDKTKISLAMNNGDGTFSVNFSIDLKMVDKITKNDDTRYGLYPYDMDGDGKTDLLVTKATFVNHGALYKGTQNIWLRFNGYKFVKEKIVVTDNQDDALAGNIVLGNFSGDGQVGLMNYGKNIFTTNNADAIKMRLYVGENVDISSGKIRSITDGLGAITEISYASLTKPSLRLSAINATKYPFVDIWLDLPVVEKIKQALTTTTYSYGGLKVHAQGKGILGFERVKLKESFTSKVNENIISVWDMNNYVPLQITTKDSIGGNCYAETVTTNRYTLKNKTYFLVNSSSKSIDYDGNEMFTYSNYDKDYGYLVTQGTYGAGRLMYKETSYGNYVQKAGVYLPQQVINIQKHEDDSQEYRQKTTFSYDDNGLVVQKVEHAGTALALTTTNEYDKFGNVTSSIVKGYGMSPITKSYTYEKTGRFVIDEYTVGDGGSIGYLYDTWGNMQYTFDRTHGYTLQTSYRYDNWGNRIKTICSNGVVEENVVDWDTTNKGRYYVEHRTTGKPTTKTFYNSFGWKVFSKYSLPDGQEHQESFDYQPNGQLFQTMNSEGKLRNYVIYLYDSRRRIRQQLELSKHRTIDYTYCNRSVTTTIGDKSYTKTMDAWGNVKTSSDPISSVSYKYNSMGKPMEVTSGDSKITITYDEVGNKSSITDPDAGTTTYEYAADGKLLKQTDARGVVATNTYDNLGRLVSTTICDSKISYTYGNSGYGNCRLVETSCNGNVESYTYDKDGRVLTKIRTVRGEKPLEYNYSYLKNGALDKVVYPGGVEISYIYDDNGYLVSKKYGSLVLSELDSYNGLVTTSSVMNNAGKVTHTLSSEGYLQSINATVRGIGSTLSYEYDNLTGNVLSREGMYSEHENFIYDDLDRLITVTQNGKEVLNVKYADNGNIIDKTGVGKYEYGLKPHAVVSVENVNGTIPSATMTTVFNDFGKIRNIQDGNTLRKVDFVYGPDMQRWKTIMTKNGNLIRTIVYGDDYEKVVEGDKTTEFYYVDDNVILVRFNNTTIRPYFVEKDNLGSVLKIYGIDASKVFDATYDVWGKQSVTRNTIGFLRGYSGHEMLNDFDIINMNGRLYDPVLGRFFSPDNYVQMPDNSQNFNRYTYCLNNPLKFTDPSGELFGIDDIVWIGAGIGAFMGAMEAKMTETPVWKGALVGGLSSFASYGVGSLFGHSIGTFGHELLRAGAHGLTSGTLSYLNGGNFFAGAMSGFSASLMGSGAQTLHFKADAMLASTAVAGGLTSWAVNGNFMDGFHIGMQVGMFNHGMGDKVKTIEKELPTVYVYGKDLSYRKTFGYWLLGIGSGASSGPYKMWNPDAFSISVGYGIQLGNFSYSGSFGWITNGSEGSFFFTGISGGTTQVGIGGSLQLSANFYNNNTMRQLSIVDYAGKGYSYGANLYGLSVDYGGGVTAKGMLDTSVFSSLGIGVGAGFGMHGGVTETTYLWGY